MKYYCARCHYLKTAKGASCSKCKSRPQALSAEIKNELYLYHCAGGHTRAQMAKAQLAKAGFRFERGVIFWPDGAVLTYKDGSVDYGGR